MAEEKNTNEKITVRCSKCNGYSSGITVEYHSHQQEIVYNCTCGNRWGTDLNIVEQGVPPESFVGIDKDTGLICISLYRCPKNGQSKSIKIMLSEDMFAPAKEGERAPKTITLKDDGTYTKEENDVEETYESNKFGTRIYDF